METVANLFLFVEDGLVKSLGVTPHLVDFANDQQIAIFLTERVAADSAIATRSALPVDQIKAELDIDAKDGLQYEVFSYLQRTGKALWLFEKQLQAINAPSTPFVVYTPIAENKPQFTSTIHANPIVNPEINSKDFGGTITLDWLPA